MQIIESSKVKEKVYIEKLDNGLTVMIIPKKGINKKYVIWGTEFGSIDNHFFIDGNEIKLPDGSAHYLEHKLFEQENGINSLDVLSSLGVDANAFTTNNYTAYLFETTTNFYEALDEFMDYVQSPYFTDENVEKERGIIEQEIKMYDDYPDWLLYMNTIKCMYKNNPINIDIAGSVESIGSINKDTLYSIYNSFYRPDNMAIVVAGDFDIEEILQEIKSRIKKKLPKEEVKRIYPDEPEEVISKEIEATKEISKPMFIVGYKDKINEKEIVKRDLSIECICNMLLGKSSRLYHRLYEKGLISGEFVYNYEYSKEYAHVLIQNTSIDPRKVSKEIDKEILYYKENGFSNEEFERIKKKMYGDYVKEYNNISDIASNFLANYFKGINTFDFLDECAILNKDYVEKVFKEIFNENKKVLSIVKGE